MKWDMEIRPPGPSFMSKTPGFEKMGESRRASWTAVENKLFENALAKYDKDTPDRWQKVAAMVPGKTVADVMRQYKELEDDVTSIEAGLIPFPGYRTNTSPFTLEWGPNGGDVFGSAYCADGRRLPVARPLEHERKKGVPWTEEEHKLFLLGLKKYGKGDWRNISRNFVITRTPTQVASHAQKYFIRQLSGGKDKRRASIHDITTVDFNNIQHHNGTLPTNAQSEEVSFQGNQPNNGTAMAFNQRHDNIFMPPRYGQNMQKGGLQVPFGSPQSLVFQMHYQHG